jgi:hypothetical protein
MEYFEFIIGIMQEKEVLELIQTIVKPLRDRIELLEKDN